MIFPCTIKMHDFMHENSLSNINFQHSPKIWFPAPYSHRNSCAPGSKCSFLMLSTNCLPFDVSSRPPKTRSSASTAMGTAAMSPPIKFLDTKFCDTTVTESADSKKGQVNEIGAISASSSRFTLNYYIEVDRM